MKIVAVSLCAALLAAPLNLDAVQTSAPPIEQNFHMFAVCLIGGAVVAGGAVIYMLKTCRPKYYCVKDEDGKQFPSNASRTERAANDWEVVSGPYNSAEDCARNCSTNSVKQVVNIPAIPMKIMSSTDLVTWTQAVAIVDDPEHFTWTGTNSAALPAMFYRVEIGN